LFGGGIEDSFGSLLLEDLSMDYGRKSNPRQVRTTMVVVDPYDAFLTCQVNNQAVYLAACAEHGSDI
jgi:hypothetical protein